MLTHRNIGVNGLTNGYNPSNYAENGRLVVRDDSNRIGGAGSTLAHEIGHTLGLEHDFVSYQNSIHLWGFMRETSGHAPVIDWDAPSLLGVTTLQGAVWRDKVPSKFHPRASGFTYTGCDDDGDCQTGHPGLVCCEDGGFSPRCVPECPE